ncbi:hypothetical protein ACFFIS_01405 [Virgibacillus soli]|uniref:Lipoprotein n=1 Tax=Paracerasibacillus soli TaxID=480284 RepID=A0ABU5CSV3_9BACI|nr:hypothetical protein [Virgibacillus soli]MDY0409411.1 hypothetical protein [Virgibacillus soli]
MTLLKRLVTLSMIFTLLVSCSMFEKPIAERDPKDLPDVMAFQDEFTRGFMTSAEEVEDGYYLFESKTGGYTMWYPEDARMDDMYYQNNKQHFEAIQFGGSHDRSTDAQYYVRAIYNNLSDVNEHQTYLDLLSVTSGYKGDYERSLHGDKTLYFAVNKYVTKSKNTTYYSFLALLVQDKSNQALQYDYTIICKNSIECSFDLNEVEQQIKSLIKSVEFID